MPKKNDTITTGAAAVSYEEAKKRLEEIVKTMESGDLPLKKSLELYKEGAVLAEICRKEVNKAEAAVRVISMTKAGEFEIEEF